MAVTNELQEAKVETVRAQNDVTFTEIKSKLELIEHRLQALPDNRSIWTASVTIILSVTAPTIAVMAFGSDRFDGGFSAAGAFARQVEENRSALQGLRTQVDKNTSALEALRVQVDSNRSEILAAIEDLRSEVARHHAERDESGKL